MRPHSSARHPWVQIPPPPVRDRAENPACLPVKRERGAAPLCAGRHLLMRERPINDTLPLPRAPETRKRNPKRLAARGGGRPRLCLGHVWAGWTSLSQSPSENQPWRPPGCGPEASPRPFLEWGPPCCAAAGDLLTVSVPLSWSGRGSSWRHVLHGAVVGGRCSRACRAVPGAPLSEASAVGLHEQCQEGRCNKTAPQAPSPRRPHRFPPVCVSVWNAPQTHAPYEHNSMASGGPTTLNGRTFSPPSRDTRRPWLAPAASPPPAT